MVPFVTPCEGCSWVALQQQLGIWTIGSSHPITLTRCETPGDLGNQHAEAPQNYGLENMVGYFGQILFEKRFGFGRKGFKAQFLCNTIVIITTACMHINRLYRYIYIYTVYIGMIFVLCVFLSCLLLRNVSSFVEPFRVTAHWNLLGEASHSMVVGTLRLGSARNPEEHLTLILGMGKCIDVIIHLFVRIWMNEHGRTREARL